MVRWIIFSSDIIEKVFISFFRYLSYRGYTRLELDDSNMVKWSTAVSLSLSTRSTSGRGGGGARFRSPSSCLD